MMQVRAEHACLQVVTQHWDLTCFASTDCSWKGGGWRKQARGSIARLREKVVTACICKLRWFRMRVDEVAALNIAGVPDGQPFRVEQQITFSSLEWRRASHKEIVFCVLVS